MKLKLYFEEAYNELVHKVSWPTRKELQSSAFVVMVASLIIALIVFVMDFSFENIMELYVQFILLIKSLKYNMSENVKKWYVLRAIGGKEKKVKEYIENEIANAGLQEYVSQVLIPTEKVYQIRNGKKSVRIEISFLVMF